MHELELKTAEILGLRCQTKRVQFRNPSQGIEVSTNLRPTMCLEHEVGFVREQFVRAALPNAVIRFAASSLISADIISVGGLMMSIAAPLEWRLYRVPHLSFEAISTKRDSPRCLLEVVHEPFTKRFVEIVLFNLRQSCRLARFLWRYLVH